MLGEQAATFVWRCSECSGVYDGEGLAFLYGDGANRYCACGGVLVEGVVAGAERRYRLVIPPHLRVTSLHRQLEDRLSGNGRVEVAAGRRDDRRIKLFGRAEE